MTEESIRQRLERGNLRWQQRQDAARLARLPEETPGREDVERARAAAGRDERERKLQVRQPIGTMRGPAYA